MGLPKSSFTCTKFDIDLPLSLSNLFSANASLKIIKMKSSKKTFCIPCLNIVTLSSASIKSVKMSAISIYF